MTQTPIIAIGGENLIDQVHSTGPDGSAIMENNPGGSPYNVAVAVARQGVQAAYLSPISTDPMGQLLAQRLEQEQVDLSAPRREEPTTMAIVTLNNGTPSYQFQRQGTAERCVTQASIAAALPEAAKALHIGSLALAGGADAQAWEAEFHRASKNGIFTSLDPNVRASLIEDSESYRSRMLRLFTSADLIKLSDEDLEWLYPAMPLDAALAALRKDATAPLIVLTKGPDGAEAISLTDHLTVPAPIVTDLQDTIGAGDTFMGTLLATLAADDALNRETIAQIDLNTLSRLITRAAQAAALNCEQKGCQPPTTAQIDQALTEQA